MFNIPSDTLLEKDDFFLPQKVSVAYSFLVRGRTISFKATENSFSMAFHAKSKGLVFGSALSASTIAYMSSITMVSKTEIKPLLIAN